MLIVVRNSDDLRALRASRRLYARDPIAFDLPGLSADHARSLAQRVNTYRNECGCSLGAKAMAVTMVVVAIWLFFRPHVTVPSLLMRIPIAFLFILLGAGAGKALGIFAARQKLRRELDDLLGNLTLTSRGG